MDEVEQCLILGPVFFGICAMVKSRYIGDGHPTFNDGILIMGPYKPLRTWVEFPIPYGNVMGVDRPDRTYGLVSWEPKVPPPRQ